MIPKTIHYCWFGRNPKPDLANKCIKSWEAYCPDFEIIEWNESNYDIDTSPVFVQQAYASGRWAFVTDYIRLKVVYDHGGVYFDTDVEVLKNIDDLLQYNAFFGTQNGIVVNTGLGFGAVAGTPILREMMQSYEHASFIKEDGSIDTTTCPERDTKVFKQHGLRGDNSFQILPGNVVRLPIEYLSPKDYMTGEVRITQNTYTIHHFAESWMSEDEKAAIEDAKRQLYHPSLRSRFKRMVVGVLGHNRIAAIRKVLGN